LAKTFLPSRTNGPDFGTDRGDELGEDVLAVADERFALVADDHTARGRVERGRDPVTTRQSEGKPAVGAVGHESPLVGDDLLRAARGRALDFEGLVIGEQRRSDVRAELVVGDGPESREVVRSVVGGFVGSARTHFSGVRVAGRKGFVLGFGAEGRAAEPRERTTGR
jgi:hypothetical protein